MDTNNYTAESAETAPELFSSQAETEEAWEEVVSLEEDFGRRRPRPKLRLFLGMLVTVLLMGGAGYFIWQHLQPGAVAGGTLIINEVCTANHESLVSETLDTPDWVELYNGSNRALNLKGYGLTDNPKQSYKYTLPDITLEAGEYLLIYFTGGNEAADNDPFCTGFGLSRYGETLMLVDANYNLLDSLEVPALEADVSFARAEDGSWGYAVIPTPGKVNGGDVIPAWK